MGSGPSKTRRVEAVLNMISETVVDSQSLCLANAENRVLIETGGAENVTVENVFIDQVSDATVDCNNETTVQLGTLNTDISARLNEIIQAADNTDSAADETKVRLVNDITTAVNERVVSSCIANAINTYEVTAEEVAGNVNVIDLNINQVAKAEMKNCLNSNNIRVGTVPLRQYLETELANFNVVPPAGAGDPVACDAVQRTQMMSYGSIGAALLLIIVMVALYATK